ncbi:protein SSUH2 homolog [Anneissia japonica]|uniref:protein SSUH2 homolog n=1 Tax=Anneissia japonica TaxID=1529436 RepID=UPI0014255D15|nr:protein SSUH2 homolog [Anneissia japonica]
MLSKQAAKDALLQHVNKHFFYSSTPAKEMTVTSIVPLSAWHYTLESFTEQRSTRETLCNDGLDRSLNGAPPHPWDVHCTPSTEFMSHQKVLEIPNTSVKKSCNNCNGRGYKICRACDGMNICCHCHGAGLAWEYHGTNTRRVACRTCYATGHVQICLGCKTRNGQITCSTCTGKGSLQYYTELVVKYTNHVSEYVLEKNGIPKDKIKGVRGQVVFQQNLPCVEPISQHSEQQIIVNSMRMVNDHRQAWPGEKIIKQRQVLRSVPVSEVAYTWYDCNQRFWVFGNEREVHAPDYPYQHLWGCNVS